MQKNNIGLHGVFVFIALQISRLFLLTSNKKLTSLRYMSVKILTFCIVWVGVYIASLIFQSFSWSFFDFSRFLISFFGAILLFLPGLGHFDNLKNEYKLNGKSELIN